MKCVLKYFVFCAVALININATAQKHDYIWFGGYSSHNGIIDSNRTYGITKLNFNFTPVEISYDSDSLSFGWVSYVWDSSIVKDGQFTFS